MLYGCLQGLCEFICVCVCVCVCVRVNVCVFVHLSVYVWGFFRLGVHHDLLKLDGGIQSITTHPHPPQNWSLCVGRG